MYHDLPSGPQVYPKLLLPGWTNPDGHVVTASLQPEEGMPVYELVIGGRAGVPTYFSLSDALSSSKPAKDNNKQAVRGRTPHPINNQSECSSICVNIPYINLLVCCRDTMMTIRIVYISISFLDL